MTNPLQPEPSSSVDIPLVVDSGDVRPNTIPPTSEQVKHSPWGEIPEQILDEWRWIFKGREEGLFDDYPGKHVAVYQQKIWAAVITPACKLLKNCFCQLAGFCGINQFI